MKHIVQTAREVVSVDDKDHSSVHLTDKVTIGCASAKEAQEIVETLQFLPNRRVFAGIEMYTEGGVKLVLSYRDVAEIMSVGAELKLNQLHLVA